MADIELVIKIPEEKYLYAKNLVDGGKETNPVVLAIGSGTPLDKIRAEIEGLQTYYLYSHTDLIERHEVFEIIDKYKAESE